MWDIRRSFVYFMVMVSLGVVFIGGDYLLEYNTLWRVCGACIIVFVSVYYALGPFSTYKIIFSDLKNLSMKELGMALKNGDREFSELNNGRRFLCLAMLMMICLMIWSMVTLLSGYLQYFGILEINIGYHPFVKGWICFIITCSTAYTALRP